MQTQIKQKQPRSTHKVRTRALFTLMKAQKCPETKAFLRDRVVHRFQRGLY